MAQAGPDFAAQVVDALNAIGGRHDGQRAVHAKGSLWAGIFTPTPEAASITRAQHMQGGPVRAHVRFSNASGDPGRPDFGRDGRGMAVKFYLPDDTTTDIVSVTSPVFLARTPEDFFELTLVRKPDPETGQPDLVKVGAYLEQHPEALPAIQHALTTDPPASYAQCTFNALHAYRFVNADGVERFGRYSWAPEAGEATISHEQAKRLGSDYLRPELVERLKLRPAVFALSAALAEEGDVTDDPTAAWPEQRERVTLGRLEVTAPAMDRERGNDVLVFDPTRVTDGIECSDDPILHFRSVAYAESVFRRSGVRR